jgi:adenosine deaminase
VRSVDDPALVARLAQDGIALTVCPLSNVKLCVYERMEQHALPQLLAAGVKATINSDDPAYFGVYVNQNYLETFAALPQLGAREAYELARNSFEASFAPEAQQRAWVAELDRCFAAAGAH